MEPFDEAVLKGGRAWRRAWRRTTPEVRERVRNAAMAGTSVEYDYDAPLAVGLARVSKHWFIAHPYLIGWRGHSMFAAANARKTIEANMPAALANVRARA